MPAVLVHGVPDTAEMWDPLLAELSRDDIVTLRLPGFGAPLPDGFGSTKEEYVEWIASQLREIGEPVDLVGHDWGSLMAQRVALTHPELLRTYTLSNGAITDRFKWHDIAVQWQTPEVGEQVMGVVHGRAHRTRARERRPSRRRAGRRRDRRHDEGLHPGAVPLGDRPPGRLGGHRAGRRARARALGKDDPVGPPASGQRFAETAGARIVLLDGGHWAAVERPKVSAVALEEHWASR